ncbi:ecdysteroid-regulated 16 kDa protein-like [Phymastichus coffea]|uniref:ecdysteroid-regulated 16 kDa protein-like n=1 Tax=Phymastichus coffea TaxID=108790 RepID=UPI00273C3A5F|nr:ecdysteroid-regulated 16 kDa protein-like [Phymastichus coffea]XP_058802859.1 ecdysteroid-regulated 16 kDa protein-like [Phymastichus coffea]XP_058802860.1 ecdysteroid-regulated 16 kDa protein-like [Phymastichus coffea]
MSNTTLILLVVAAVFGSQVNATKVNKCDGYPNPNNSVVSITNCDEPPCYLKKDSKMLVMIRFTPDHNIYELTTRVWGKKWIWMAYSGVDSTSACDKVYYAADGTPASCPLMKGVDYIYKYELYIDPWYPSISMIIHWSLQEYGNDIECFQVDGEITS